jgi:hypothetical protein
VGLQKPTYPSPVNSDRIKYLIMWSAGLKPGTYEDKCKEAVLETLEQRREVQDLAQTYKMIQGKEKLNKQLFSHVDGGRTRQDADPLNLKQKPARLEIKRNFFTQRVVKKWNAIPSDVKRAKNVNMFKKHYKNLLRNGPDGRPEENRMKNN